MNSTFLRAGLLFLIAFCFGRAVADESPVQSLLRNKNFSELDAALTRVQIQFESRTLSETELRNAYRPFYTLDAETEANLADWANLSPSSYVAHLALGINFKRKGTAARGNDYISNTPKQNIDEMVRYFAQARAELEKSLPLTKVPYLSVWHLLDMANIHGDKVESLRLLLVANKLLPDNRLARNRYMQSLKPRWGGSIPDMEQFIETSRREGLDQDGIMQLEAIMQEDLGLSTLETGDLPLSREHFIKALELAKKIGGTFLQDWLSAARYQCTRPEFSAYCD